MHGETLGRLLAMCSMISGIIKRACLIDMSSHDMR